MLTAIEKGTSWCKPAAIQKDRSFAVSGWLGQLGRGEQLTTATSFTFGGSVDLLTRNHPGDQFTEFWLHRSERSRAWQFHFTDVLLIDTHPFVPVDDQRRSLTNDLCFSW